MRSSALRAAFWILYVVCVVLWFKDSLPPLKSIGLGPRWPCLGLAVLGALRLYLAVRAKRIKIRIPVNKAGLAALLLLCVALGFRLPFLPHSFGLINSDDAVPALMAKHIAEGGVPPVYYYGQLYLGSVAEHVLAPLFVLFGYSLPLYKFVTLLFFLGFVLLMFVFLEKIFPFPFAFAAALLYCLPWGWLLNLSFDGTGMYALVLLLGTAQLYLSYLVCWRQRQDLIPSLGFLMGLAFWAHQISVAFVLTALLVMVWKLGWRIKNFLTLMVFAGIGCLPVILLEVTYGFRLSRFLLPGEGKLFLWDKTARLLRLSRDLVSLDRHPVVYAFLGLALVGWVVLGYRSFRGKTTHPGIVFGLFFPVFCALYLISGFSTREAVRYLYPLFFCLPVLLLSGCLLIRGRISSLVLSVVIILLVIPFNGRGYLAALQGVKARHQSRKIVVTAMERTGKQHWRGEYWTAYLLTALSGERLLVDSSTFNRYFPYRLAYDNDQDRGNFVFRISTAAEETRARRFIDSLVKLQLDHKQERIGDWLLVYDTDGNVSPDKFKGFRPGPLPEPELTDVRSAQGRLQLNFSGIPGPDAQGFWIHAEIPGYSSHRRSLSSPDDPVEVRLPYPPDEALAIRYHVEYKGCRIPSMSRQYAYSLPVTEPRKRIVILSGLGPRVDTFAGPRRVCRRELSFELNRVQKYPVRVRLGLYSPFRFSHPYWYGQYAQSLRIRSDQRLIKEVTLDEGENTIEFELQESDATSHRITIRLEFKYHSRFDFFMIWRIAGLLEKIEVETGGPDAQTYSWRVTS